MPEQHEFGVLVHTTPTARHEGTGVEASGSGTADNSGAESCSAPESLASGTWLASGAVASGTDATSCGDDDASTSESVIASSADGGALSGLAVAIGASADAPTSGTAVASSLADSLPASSFGSTAVDEPHPRAHPSSPTTNALRIRHPPWHTTYLDRNSGRNGSGRQSSAGQGWRSPRPRSGTTLPMLAFRRASRAAASTRATSKAPAVTAQTIARSSSASVAVDVCAGLSDAVKTRASTGFERSRADAWGDGCAGGSDAPEAVNSRLSCVFSSGFEPRRSPRKCLVLARWRSRKKVIFRKLRGKRYACSSPRRIEMTLGIVGGCVALRASRVDAGGPAGLYRADGLQWSEMDRPERSQYPSIRTSSGGHGTRQRG